MLDDFKAQLPYAEKLAAMMNGDDKQRRYNIAYFGGEPLLNISTIFEIDDYLKSINFPVAMSHIQTNSMLLTSEMSREIKERGIAMSYSFDGLTDSVQSIAIHEQQLASGLINQDAKIMIDGETVDKLVENYMYFLKLGFKKPDFTFVRDDIWSTESLATAKQTIHDLVDVLINLTRTTNEVHVVGFVKLWLMDTLSSKVFGRRDFTCFAGRNGFAFTPSRVIYPCSRFYSNDKFRLVDVNKDVVYEDTIAELKTKLNLCSATECDSCSVKPYCFTGCAYTQLLNGNCERMVPVAGYCALLDIVQSETMRFYRELRDLDVFKKFIHDEVGNGITVNEVRRQ